MHKELKVFAALNEISMIELAGFAIMEELKKRGHKFAPPKPEKNKK